MTDNAARLREQAVEAARLGRIDEASALHARAARAAPRDPSVLNSAAFFFSKHGDVDRAIRLLRQAIAAAPNATEPLFNLALIMTGAGQAGETFALLAAREQSLGHVARYWSIRAGAERALGRKRDALTSYERASTLDPANARALHGRARMSLETGLAPVEQYRALVAAQPGDREAWLGLAQALDVARRGDEATALLTDLVAKAPDWIEALELLAQLRWAGGDRAEFADHYRVAVGKAGGPAIYASWCRMLAGADRYAEAAEVAAEARRVVDDPGEFALAEAVHRGECGDDQAAAEIFANLPASTPGRLLHEARHRMRVGDPAAAEALAAQMIGEDPDNISAWALRGIAWRLLGDPRSEWLHGQPGLIATIPLDLGDEMKKVITYLDHLHDASTVPVGQSVRGGTQTRGGLFDRHEPEARRISKAFKSAMETYRAGLPKSDESHPLLRHRDAPWRIAGSWSIRLEGAGHHVPHIHPNGIISSAAYFAVPSAAAEGQDRAGWLELGRPPVDLRLDLPPLATIEPRVDACALFPSGLYHGTRGFAAGKRMSAAIDIQIGSSK